MFYGFENAENKHKIMRRYVRNDLPPVLVAELDPWFSPRVVYTNLQRGEVAQGQRVFLFGGFDTKVKNISDAVYEIDLVASQTAKGASLIRKS